MAGFFKSLVLSALLYVNVTYAEDTIPGWAKAFKVMTETKIPEFTIKEGTKLRDALSKLSAEAAKLNAAFSTIVGAEAGNVLLPEFKLENASVHDILRMIGQIGSRPVSISYQPFGIQVGSDERPATFVTGKLNPGIKVDGWSVQAVSIFGPISQYALDSKTGEFHLLCPRDKADHVLEWLVDTKWVKEYTVVELNWPLNSASKLRSTLLKESPFAQSAPNPP